MSNLRETILIAVVLTISTCFCQNLYHSSYETENPNESGRKIYHVPGNVELNWYDAAEYCKRHSMQLASILTPTENEQFEATLEKLGLSHQRFWVGARDPLKNGNFVWVQKNTPMTYKNWYGGAPGRTYTKEDEPNCVKVLSSYLHHKWEDNFCRVKSFFVCQKFTRDPIETEDNILRKKPKRVSVNGKTYIFVHNEVEANKAADECKSENATLVEILSHQDRDKIVGIMNDDSAVQATYWIKKGINDQGEGLEENACLSLSYTFSGVLMTPSNDQCSNRHYVLCEIIDSKKTETVPPPTGERKRKKITIDIVISIVDQ